MGIALSGSGFGTLLFPPLHEYLLLLYGISGYFLVMAGIQLHTTIFSAVMRVPHWIKITKNTTKMTSSRYKAINMEPISRTGEVSSSVSDTEENIRIQDTHDRCEDESLYENLGTGLSRNEDKDHLNENVINVQEYETFYCEPLGNNMIINKSKMAEKTDQSMQNYSHVSDSIELPINGCVLLDCAQEIYIMDSDKSLTGRRFQQDSLNNESNSIKTTERLVNAFTEEEFPSTFTQENLDARAYRNGEDMADNRTTKLEKCLTQANSSHLRNINVDYYDNNIALQFTEKNSLTVKFI